MFCRWACVGVRLLLMLLVRVESGSSWMERWEWRGVKRCRRLDTAME